MRLDHNLMKVNYYPSKRDVIVITSFMQTTSLCICKKKQNL